jgi:hypothetical protein
VQIVPPRNPTTIFWNDFRPPGPLNLPRGQMDLIFGDLYPLPEGYSTALSAVEYWSAQLAQIDELARQRGWNAETKEYWRREFQRVVDHYQPTLDQGEGIASDAFYRSLTAPPDPARQQQIYALNQRIDTLTRQLEKKETEAIAVSGVVNLLTLGIGGVVVDAIYEGVDGALMQELVELSAQRAQLDGTANRAFVAANLTNHLINLLERGGPYSAEEDALIAQIGSMVQASAVEVADNQARLFREWKAKQDAERALMGSRNLAILFDTGSPPPDFSTRALSMAGLGVAGSGSYASMIVAAGGASLAIAGSAADAAMGKRLQQVIFPYSRRKAGPDVASELDEVAPPPPKNVTKWRSANPTELRKLDDAEEVLYGAWRARIQRGTAQVAGEAGELTKIVGKADDVARLGRSVTRAVDTATDVAKQVGKVAKKVTKAIGKGMKVLGPIGEVASIALEVAVAAGTGADAADNGQQRLDAAAQKARNTPVETNALRNLVSTEDGRAQLIAVLASQLTKRGM